MNHNRNPLISVVLLSFNRPAFLQEALASLIQQSYENIEITVVDNLSSASEEVARIVSKHPNVRLIRNSLNLGFTGGMNAGIRQACGDYVYLTEDDMVLEPDCLQVLVEYMENDVTADLVAPLIYDKRAQTIRCAGGEFELAAVYRLRIFGSGELDIGQFSQPFDVNYIAGAALFARSHFWGGFKGFREEYFMYLDDVELCARVNRAGKRLTVVPQAKVHHFELPVDEKSSPEIHYHKVKNLFSLYFLHASARVLPEFVCRYGVVNTARALGETDGSLRSVLRALVWIARRTPSLLRERRSKAGSQNISNWSPEGRASHRHLLGNHD